MSRMLSLGKHGFAFGQRFYLLWLGESVALLGTALMEFALGVWIYGNTGSAVAFADIVLAAMVPAVIVLPLAGSLADGIGRRATIITVDLALAMAVVVIIAILRFSTLQPIELYIFNVIASVLTSFRRPAYQASVNSVLVPEMFTRASGLMGMSRNTAALVAPLLAGVIMAKGGLIDILLIDVVTFCAGTLLVARALSHWQPQSHRGPAVASYMPVGQGRVGVLRSLTDAMAFFRRDRIMLGLLLYTTLRNAIVSLATLMMTPLVLASHSSQTLGLVYMSAAIGGIIGASTLMSMGNPRRLMMLALASDLLIAACIVALGLAASSHALCGLAFIAVVASSVADGAVNALWMRNIPSSCRASVFALISMAMMTCTALAIYGSGTLIDLWLQPALSAGGGVERVATRWFGLCKTGGTSLLFVLAGIADIVLCLGMLAWPRLRRLELVVMPGASSNDDPCGSPLLRAFNQADAS